MSATEWQETLSGGCEWCGTKLAALKQKNYSGYVTYGLHEAHIFAQKYAPVQSWNTFLLCPNCHAVFDSIIKPRLQKAIEIALSGFEDPAGSGKCYVVARSHEDLLERLITKDKSTRQKELDEPSKLKEWHDRSTAS